VVGLGALVSGAAATVGSGAFTSVEADRGLEVQTAIDSDAFLKMDAIGEAERSSDGDLVVFRFPSLGEKYDDVPNPNPQNPKGLGTDSVYRFASDVDGSNGLFTIQNQGTQAVDVYAVQEDTADVPEVRMFDVETGELLTESDPYEGLGVGADPLRLGFEIDTTDVDVQDQAYQLILTIIAEASESGP